MTLTPGLRTRRHCRRRTPVGDAISQALVVAALVIGSATVLADLCRHGIGW
ncbi:hypothetical protein MKI84_08360 [Ancylobacter sp. A5.8]|uniref:hypothetical protein n=1 Tax=Ancylobacter gelatini TaxID=2919920 RepID=UPI001F4E42D6|nr:hypothetical protein [Ancylobacter gelatini]MCJ8142927.1 hypothetical protein [Ancylobacter gelatini]